MSNKKEKTAGELLAEKLLEKPEHAALRMTDEELAEADRFCEGYKDFITRCKTLCHTKRENDKV